MSHGPEHGDKSPGAKPAAAPQPDAKPKAQPNLEPKIIDTDPDEERKKEVIQRIWLLRLIVVLTLVGGPIATYFLRKPTIIPNQQYDTLVQQRGADLAAEQELNNKLNQQILGKGGVMNDFNHNAIPPRLKDRSTNIPIVHVQIPGERTYNLIERDKKGNPSLKTAERDKGWYAKAKRTIGVIGDWFKTIFGSSKKDGKEKPLEEYDQIFELNEECAEKFEAFRLEVVNTLGIDMRIISGFESNAHNFLRMQKLNPNKTIDPAEMGGPTTTGECAFEISPVNATNRKIPRVDANGNVTFIGDNVDKNNKDDTAALEAQIDEATIGQTGAFDAVMGTAQKHGFTGSHCGERGKPYLFVSTDTLPKDHPGRDCNRNSKHYLENREYLAQNPIVYKYENIDDILLDMCTTYRVKCGALLWRKVKEKGNQGIEKGIEKGNQGIDWLKEQGAKIDIWIQNKENKEK